MRIDGQHMVSDVPPITTLRGAFVPLRAIGLGIGAVTNYDVKTGGIEIMRGRDVVLLHVGERHGKLNGMAFTMRHAPFVVRGRVMVPVGLFEAALGSSVRYDSVHESIEITSGRARDKSLEVP